MPSLTKGWEDGFGTQRGSPLSDSEYWLLVTRASNGNPFFPPPKSLKSVSLAGIEAYTTQIAIARSNINSEVFVSMDSEGGTRSVFNGVQTYDGKGNIKDPATWKPTNKGTFPLQTTTHNTSHTHTHTIQYCPSPPLSPPLPPYSLITGAAQTFHQTSLPLSMRNPNTNKNNRLPSHQPRRLHLHYAVGF